MNKNNTMTKKISPFRPNPIVIINTPENYCSLGKSYGCPDSADCPTRGIISIEVLQVDRKRETYYNPEHPKESPKSITPEIMKKIESSKKWPGQGIEELAGTIYTCTETRQEGRELIFKSYGGDDL